ncbi:DUF6308 family protein [Dactylosporangium sp. NPDC048998]|uniref:DUF6308 family protein n=1 Tax=Dactylosporangium sp. NPDC048998 TaxID=3363976 RepID=UPI003710E1D7
MTADLLDIVRDAGAEHALRRYFAEDAAERFSGRRFEMWRGGDDRADTRNVITDDDLVAIQMLNVKVPAEVAIHLLDGTLGRKISGLLAGIDATTELGTAAAADLLNAGAPAYRAWQLLKQQHGIDYVIASKLLARKRPALIPVYDGVIRCRFGAPAQVWRKLHGQLAADDERLRREAANLRTRANIPAAVSVLRVPDVVLWMRHHVQHTKRGCPGRGAVPLV